MGHNSYGEPAWPNDILYVFPIVILSTLTLVLGLSITYPVGIDLPANAFCTPIEILPEWYFLASFNLLRIIPSKIIGVLSMMSLVIVFLITCFLENITIYSNPYRRPVSVSASLIYLVYSVWCCIGGLVSISESIPLV